MQQLEARGPAGGQPSFTQMELQKQMETLKQQLLFREQEVRAQLWGGVGLVAVLRHLHHLGAAGR